mgnify:CR=1 FL=1
MTARPEAPPPQPSRLKPRTERALSMPEFVALMAMLSATIAFSIDAMLPALPEIGRELSPGAPNAAQLVIFAFVFGMGLGTLFAGPLSDALGRKWVMIGGAVVYSIAAALATIAPSLEMLLAVRVLQGLGASGPRVAAQAMVRDLYAGRGMARVASFIMMTFSGARHCAADRRVHHRGLRLARCILGLRRVRDHLGSLAADPSARNPACRFAPSPADRAAARGSGRGLRPS